MRDIADARDFARRPLHCVSLPCTNRFAVSMHWRAPERIAAMLRILKRTGALHTLRMMIEFGLTLRRAPDSEGTARGIQLGAAWSDTVRRVRWGRARGERVGKSEHFAKPSREAIGCGRKRSHIAFSRLRKSLHAFSRRQSLHARTLVDLSSMCWHALSRWYTVFPVGDMNTIGGKGSGCSGSDGGCARAPQHLPTIKPAAKPTTSAKIMHSSATMLKTRGGSVQI